MDIKVPQVGEAILEVTIAKWRKGEGDAIAKGDLLCELETDKITLELNAEVAGTLHIRVAEGETAAIGTVIADIREAQDGENSEIIPEVLDGEERAAQPESMASGAAETPALVRSEEPASYEAVKPAAAAEKKEQRPADSDPMSLKSDESGIRRRPLSPIRKRIAERLVAARQQTAMLTTFNEIDMQRLQALRERHRERFKERHGVRLGLVSFFVVAAVEALRDFQEVNAFIDGDDIVYHDHMNVGVAVGAEKGLVVPVWRNAERLHLWEVEKGIATFVEKITDNRLELADLEGGTFTITNGGVFGSLLSTPLLNFPQSAILGLHAVQQRPVARNGEIVIRPMMYVALSYDHRIIDGRGAVGFLKRIKELIEEPERMLLEV